MKKQDQLFQFLNNLLLTPSEYADTHKVPLRTIYWQMDHDKLHYVTFKGKKLIINKELNLEEIKNIL